MVIEVLSGALPCRSSLDGKRVSSQRSKFANGESTLVDAWRTPPLLGTALLLHCLGGKAAFPGVSLFQRYGERTPNPILMRGIRAWGKDHYQRTGEWPCQRSGACLAEPAETWANIDSMLRYGGRGLPSGSSLAALFGERKRGPFMRAWAPEALLRERIRTLRVKDYEQVRHTWGLEYPANNHFPRIYGKTYAQLRAGDET